MNLKRTLSLSQGKGSLGHNSRAFKADNIDASRSQFNRVYANEDINKVYTTLFGEALEKYNAKQKRNDRKIPDYYEKIRTSKQEKLFYEIIVQVGNCDDMGTETENGKIAEQILDKYMADFKERNPSLYVFSAHLHMDEATPHLHIDFIPFTSGNTRGLETKNSLKGALNKLGFNGGTRSSTELSQWQDSEKEIVAKLMLEHGIEWDKQGGGKKHLSIETFKAEKKSEEVKALDVAIENKQNKLEAIVTKETKIKDINAIETKPTLLDKNKITVLESDYKQLETLAKKQIASDKKESKAVKENKKLKQDFKALQQEHQEVKSELLEFKSVTTQLNVGKEKAKINELEKQNNLLMKFLDFMGLREKFDQFKRSILKTKQEELNER